MPCNISLGKDEEISSLYRKKDNSQKYNELIVSGNDISSELTINIPDGYILNRTETSDKTFIIALLSKHTESVVYYISCTMLSDINLPNEPVTQVALWRTSNPQHKNATHDIATNVFNDYLLVKYNITASDANHTTEGRDFWVRQTAIAIEKSNHVYRYDQMNSVLDEITDHEVIATDNDTNWIWGNEPRYATILLIISKHEIKLNK